MVHFYRGWYTRIVAVFRPDRTRFRYVRGLGLLSLCARVCAVVASAIPFTLGADGRQVTPFGISAVDHTVSSPHPEEGRDMD